ncbi:MAG TPA: hypothetical protein VK849_07615, partial [Longimicrobiales bacterium]|nr:hypothetical protein [Longimicrobiales bacterium]
DLVRLHGFEVERLSRPVSVEARAYPGGAPDRVPADMAGGLPLDAAPDASSFLVRIRREFPAGTWVVRSAQPGFRLLFTLLEPWSEDAPLGREGKTIRRHGDAGPEARTGLYPVYRVDADALDRLLTEGAPQVSPRADGAG